MFGRFFGLLAATASSVTFGITPVNAQGAPGVIYTVILPGGGFGSAAFLKELVQGLGAARAFCAGLQDEALTVDCLADRLDRVANDIPEGTDYEEVRNVLAQTSQDLAQLARSNRDPGRSRARVSTTDKSRKSSRALVPVRPEAQAQVNAAAAAILDEAVTVLLRSAASEKKRSGQYAQIASAIDSNKVLLRST